LSEAGLGGIFGLAIFGERNGLLWSTIVSRDRVLVGVLGVGNVSFWLTKGEEGCKNGFLDSIFSIKGSLFGESSEV
jgi:hypothetical protein